MSNNEPRLSAGKAVGRAVADRHTKRLVQRIAPGDIAIISHADIDEVSASSIIAAKPMAVVNASQSITGRYRCPGPLMLLDAGIPVLDGVGEQLLDLVADGDEIEVREATVYRGGVELASGEWLTRERVEAMYERAEENLEPELEKFVVNTLQYAIKEKDIILGGVECPAINTRIRGRHCLIAVRGSAFREDLEAIQSYICDMRPVLIGVDGGADALLEKGFPPDIIIGDMDSVSDHALGCGAELIAHAYPDGRSPASDRLTSMGLPHMTFRCPGTSEDAAMLLAYDKGASLIVALGAHSNMRDFLEKGRPGMGSTFLARLKVGALLVDARGVSELYRGRLRVGHIAWILAAATVPLAASVFSSHAVSGIAKLILLRIRVMLGFL
ncbi:MAG: putative cytokinetic ring protein SteA [Clostridia bacterium]|nr:putative cytokinetic ring protein SteA [Clostridia bacterium]